MMTTESFQTMETQANAMLLKLPNWDSWLRSRAEDRLLSIQKEIKKKRREPVASSQEPVNSNLFSVKCFIDTLVDIFHLFGMHKPDGLDNKYKQLYTSSIQDSIRVWMQYADSKGPDSSLWKDLGKWKICSFFSVVYHQDLPTEPAGLSGVLLKPRYLLSGVFKIFLKQVISTKRDLLKTFALTILQSKKGAPALSPKHIKKACFNTFLELTAPPKVDPPIAIIEDKSADISNIFDSVQIRTERSLDGFKPILVKPNPLELRPVADVLTDYEVCHAVIDEDWIKEQLIRTVKEIFGRIKITPEDIYAPIFPSTSANYNYGRDGMGAVGNFYDIIPEAGNVGYLMKTSLGHMDLENKISSLYGSQRKDEEVKLFDIQKENPLRNETLGLLFDPSDIEVEWKKAYDKLWKHSLEECPLTKTVGLPEPFKVRVITCGPPSTYTVLHPFQKFFWKVLRKHKVFSLIGEPVTKEIVFDRLGYLADNEEFLSGDYVSATDKMKSWVSETINEELFNQLRGNSREVDPDFLHEAEMLCKRALTGHYIENPLFGEPYDPSYGISEEIWEKFKLTYALKQENGQLMGSIISFIYLCIANFALCRAALEIAAERIYTLDDTPLLINGDDNLSKTLKGRGRLVWEAILKMAGLASSVGKTYFSDKFAVINSTHFDYVQPKWEDGGNANPFTERKYINIGLVYGQKKSGERGKSPHVLGALHHELKAKCPESYWEQADKLFKKRNELALKQYKLPWYLPQWLGGLGLVRPADYDSELDRAVAHSVMITLKTNTFGFDVPKIVSDKPQWMMFQRAQQDLRSQYGWLDQHPYTRVEYEGTTRELGEENQKLRKWMIIGQLFSHPLGLPCGHSYEDKTQDGRKLYCGQEPVGKRDDGFLKLPKCQNDLRHNEKCWATHVARLYKSEHFHRRCFENKPSYEDLESINLDFSFPCFEDRPGEIRFPKAKPLEA